MTALPARAQITTGTVSGTVKDAQGGVIPGATVVLISETKGTKSQARSPTARGPMFPNVTADTYTVEVSMQGFKTLAVRTCRCRAATASRSAASIEVGGTSETVNVTAESPLVQAQSGERSFAVSDRADREPADRAQQLHLVAAFTPGVVAGGNSAGGTRLGGAGQNNIMMDGVSAMDTGNNGQMLNMNVESIAEVKVLTQGYQAEYGRSSGLQITAVTKSGTNQFPRLGLRHPHQLGLGREQLGRTRRTAIRRPQPGTKTLGYTLGGPVGKPGGSNKLFFFYSHEYRPAIAASTAATPSGCACRRRGARRRLLADPLTTTAQARSAEPNSMPVRRGQRSRGNVIPANSSSYALGLRS